LGSIPLYFINSPLSAVVAVVGMVIMCIGVLMAFIIEPVFRVVYRYISKKD
jgi:cytochrome bd-type quinol oxidase subunit 1